MILLKTVVNCDRFGYEQCNGSSISLRLRREERQYSVENDLTIKKKKKKNRGWGGPQKDANFDPNSGDLVIIRNLANPVVLALFAFSLSFVV